MKSTIFRNHQKTRLKRYLFPKFTVKSVVEHTQLDMTTIQAVLDEDDGIGSGCRQPSQHGHRGQDRDRTTPNQAERREDGTRR